ncbi:MAG TPA: HAMP domain-containing sensor histidine kinase [Anaerolineales bacterium]|nr:HAMP domain-containing sensor histidine kinase [Anaerolineales bacterium]HRQ91750.1 HAMP domain-containing sensor histidine kinase [Anaerolineales bacterium]
MSIRLRITILYTAILALTLCIFGAVLYFIQAQSTLDSLRSDLLSSAMRLGEAVARSSQMPHSQPPLGGIQTPPLPFGEFSNEQAFQSFPEREIARVLDAQGRLVASPFGREGDALPLSAEGLQALQDGQEWWETSDVAGEPMLIYSRPIVVDDEFMSIIQVATSLAERSHSLRTLATTVLGAGLLIVIIAFGVGWVFSGAMLAPIQRITLTAQAIGDEQDFTHRVNYVGPQDEVGLLANTFNSMLSRLQNAFQRVEHSLQMQREFVADISHELRTPLTTLRGNLSLLRRNPPMPSEEREDILNDLIDENDRLIRLVNDLLLLARADAGRELARDALDAGELLKDVTRQAQVLDPERSIRLQVPERLTMLGDRDALKQILLIAVENAIKHSHGEISVAAELKQDTVEIRVQDRGQGIAADQLPHIFGRFYRAEGSEAATGFGLGLAIAKTLVEKQSGHIKMKSEPGQGSTLILQFPMQPQL